MDLLAVGLKKEKLRITKRIFNRNTNIESEFKVLFSFFFLFFQISGTRFLQPGAISFFLLVSCILFSGASSSF